MELFFQPSQWAPSVQSGPTMSTIPTSAPWGSSGHTFLQQQHQPHQDHQQHPQYQQQQHQQQHVTSGVISPYPVNSVQKITNIKDHYKLVKEIGKGFSATVYEAIMLSTNHSCALKVIAKERQLSVARESYFRDIYSYLRQLPCKYAVRVIDALEDDTYFYIATDKCNGPDLVKFVLDFDAGKIPLEIVKRVARSLLKAVHHLHTHRILHRDIKLDNLMLRKAYAHEDPMSVDVALIDFDMCMFYDRSDPPKHSANGRVSVVGTKEYMAPESYRGIYTCQSDVWSCGVILFLLLDGHFPFDLSGAADHASARAIVMKGAKMTRSVLNASREAADLCMRMLAPKPSDRIQSIAEALNHPFLAEAGRYYPSPSPPLVNQPYINQPSQTTASSSSTSNNAPQVHPSPQATAPQVQQLQQQQHLSHPHTYVSQPHNSSYTQQQQPQQQHQQQQMSVPAHTQLYQQMIENRKKIQLLQEKYQQQLISAAAHALPSAMNGMNDISSPIMSTPLNHQMIIPSINTMTSSAQQNQYCYRTSTPSSQATPSTVDSESPFSMEHTWQQNMKDEGFRYKTSN